LRTGLAPVWWTSLNWCDEFRHLGDAAFSGQGRNRDEELMQLKRESAKVKQEREFLRDAVIFFARESK